MTNDESMLRCGMRAVVGRGAMTKEVSSVSLLLLLRLSAAFFFIFRVVESYECANTKGPLYLEANFTGVSFTLDGNPTEWAAIEGNTFHLLKSVGAPDEFPDGTGEMTLKAAHDGHNIFFLFQIEAHYLWSSEAENLAPAVALMFGVGSQASLFRMGGCPQKRNNCSHVNCRGHEVDIMHFKTSTAVPGRVYGDNVVDNSLSTGQDRIGALDDMFGWNSQCKGVDSYPKSPNKSNHSRLGNYPKNDWSGSWSHSAINTSNGLTFEDEPFGNLVGAGTFYFEFSRPLQTSDDLNQDIQFKVGSSHRLAAAVWYPNNLYPWAPSQHYTISCDWVTLNINDQTGKGVESGTSQERDSTSPAQAVGSSASMVALVLALMALIFSLASFSVVLVGLWWFQSNGSRFTSINQTDDL